MFDPKQLAGALGGQNGWGGFQDKPDFKKDLQSEEPKKEMKPKEGGDEDKDENESTVDQVIEAYDKLGELIDKLRK